MNVRAICLDRVVANVEIASRSVVKVLPCRVYPGHACMTRDRGIWLVQVVVDRRTTRNCYRGRSVCEVVDVLGADDMDFGEAWWHIGRWLSMRHALLAGV